MPCEPELLEEASFGVAGHDARAGQSDVYAERAVGGVDGAALGRRCDLLLARQLIAAKLNIANGSDPTTIVTTVADADRLLAMFGGKLPYGVTLSSALGQSMVSDRDLLVRY